MREKLTPALVAKKEAAASQRVIYWDASMPGFGLMVTRKGHKSFVVQYRTSGRSRRMHLKAGLTLRDARKEAKAILGAVAKGGDPLGKRREAEQAKSNTLKAIVEEYLAREGDRLRTIGERRAVLRRLVLPKLGARQIGDITRSDITRLLDRIADENGAPMADHTLAYLRRVMSWHASRSDDFRSPIVRGMARTRPSQRRRQRVLSDNELRAAWRAAEASRNAFSYFVQFLAADSDKTHRSGCHAASRGLRRGMDDSAGALQDRPRVGRSAIGGRPGFARGSAKDRQERSCLYNGRKAPARRILEIQTGF